MHLYNKYRNKPFCIFCIAAECINWIQITYHISNKFKTTNTKERKNSMDKYICNIAVIVEDSSHMNGSLSECAIRMCMWQVLHVLGMQNARTMSCAHVSKACRFVCEQNYCSYVSYPSHRMLLNIGSKGKSKNSVTCDDVNVFFIFFIFRKYIFMVILKLILRMKPRR